ncbi:hypothetical protein ACMT1E_04370 [Sphingomonas flavalba]|uniref:hypothetical protein n=1 Tax=Sphingomonas flavalba TaxID=2559804 RepID=UPI0039E1B61A
MTKTAVKPAKIAQTAKSAADETTENSGVAGDPVAKIDCDDVKAVGDASDRADGEGVPGAGGWPGGLPFVTHEELDAAVGKAVAAALPGALDTFVQEQAALHARELAAAGGEKVGAADAVTSLADQAEADAAAKKRAKAEKAATKAREEAEMRAREQAALDYQVANSGCAVVAAEIAWSGEARLRFAEDGAFVPWIGPIPIDAGDVSVNNGRVVYDKPVHLNGDQPYANIDEVWLIGGDGIGVRCAISGGLRAGGGRRAFLPGGHLIF